MNFFSSQVFPGFMSFFPRYLLIFSKFHDISRFSRCTLIFPGFPGRVGTLSVAPLKGRRSSRNLEKTVKGHVVVKTDDSELAGRTHLHLINLF